MIYKMIPNILSVSRMVLAITLLFVDSATLLFYVMYCVCGLTDALDGFLARRFDVVSKLGKRLDLAGDIVFTCAILVLIFTIFTVPLWIILWVGAIALIRLVAWLISYVRFRMLFTHTYLDRGAGVVLFLLVPASLLLPFGFTVSVTIVLMLATLAAFDVLALSILARQAQEGLYSVFHIQQFQKNRRSNS